jgi:hypothetical protein
MTTDKQILTPSAVSEAIELSTGGRWRKQILPLRSIEYKGRTLDFNRQYLTGLRDSFKRRAFDQVPVQIADSKNKHNNDPRNFGGDLVDVELASDGLYGIFEPSPGGRAILETNPKIGVSARILEGYTRSDGKQFPKALQHVLLTVDPHIAGMKPWEKVELSSELEAADTLDLSDTEYEQETGMVVKKAAPKAEDKTTDGEPITLSAEEYATFQEMAKQHAAVLEFTANLDPADVEDDPDDEEDAEDTEDGEDKAPTVDPNVTLTLDAQSAQILELTNRLREKDIQRELDDLADTGLAPSIIEAARPLLSVGEGTIELSNGEDLDLGEATRSLLKTITELANNGEALVNFDAEVGLSAESDPQQAARTAMLDAWEAVSPTD